MAVDIIWDGVWEGGTTVEWTLNIEQSTDETAKKVIFLLSKNVDNFGFFYLSDLENVGGKHKNLLSKSLWTYEWVEIFFQSTNWPEWWYIVIHSHNDNVKNDITDELIIMMNKEWIYWDEWEFESKNWIMRIPTGDKHWWKSNWNWISLKPIEYIFIWNDVDWGLIYWNWQKKIKIMKLSWGKVFSTRELWYKDDILLLEVWEWLVNRRKITNNKILSSWNFVIIWEME